MSRSPIRSVIGRMLIFMAILSVWTVSAQVEFHVSPKGKDSNPGTKRAPFATLERARDAIRHLKQKSGVPAGGVTVWLHQGDYWMTQSFALTNGDSGEPGRPIIYRAAEGGKIQLLGGQALPAKAFHPVTTPEILSRLDITARKKVLCVGVSALGITNLGTFPDKFNGAALVSELFFNDERMTLARWPNEGWAEFTNVVESGPAKWRNYKTDKFGEFEFESDRLERWRNAPAIWLNGYWCFDWSSEFIRVRKIDVKRHRIRLARHHSYGLGKGNPGPRRFYAVNLLEELDRPGEYFIDRSSDTLYFWPPGPLRKGRPVLSTLFTPVVSLQNVSNVTLHGLTVMDCAGTGIFVKNCRSDEIIACRVRNTGRDGIVVEGGERDRVVACDISDTAVAGLRISGGDRKTLTPCGHEAVNNHIYRIARRQLTHAYHIHIGGVGVRVAHNLLHDGPHQAIGLSGNDHVIEFNEVYRTGNAADDSGAFYMGRNPSERGSILRYNFFHDVASVRTFGSCAVYFDGGSGGQRVFGNVFYHASGGKFGAVFLHGSQGNVVANNIFIECSLALGHDPWKHEKEFMLAHGPAMLLKDVNITRPPYSDRYPGLKGYLNFDGRELNVASNNVAWDCRAFTNGVWTVTNNYITDTNPGFVDAKAMNYQLRDDSIVFKKLPGFQRIPFERIGLVQDELRKEVERR